MEKINTQDVRAAAETSRRGFMKGAAHKAAWVAPALAVMVAASSTPAHAQHRYYTHMDKPCSPTMSYFRTWFRVHRGRGW